MTDMPVVHGVFGDGDRAVAALEALRTGGFPTDHVRLIAGPAHATEFASSAVTTNVAAGPTEPLVGGLLGRYLTEDRLTDLQRRVDDGAVLFLADDVTDDEAQRLSASLREHGAQDVEIFSA